MARDLASVRLTDETTAAQFYRFTGAIRTAERLGLHVRLRVVDDPIAASRDQRIPLDIYAEVSTEIE